MNSNATTKMKGRKYNGDESPPSENGDNDNHMDEGEIRSQLYGDEHYPCTANLLEIPQQTGGNQSVEAAGACWKQEYSTTDEAYHPGDVTDSSTSVETYHPGDEAESSTSGVAYHPGDVTEPAKAVSLPAEQSSSSTEGHYRHIGGIEEWLNDVWEEFIAAWEERREEDPTLQTLVDLATGDESWRNKDCDFRSITSCCIQIGEIFAIGSFGIVKQCQVKVKGQWVSGVIKSLIYPKYEDIVDFEREAAVLQTLSGISGVPELYGRHGKQGTRDIVMSHNGSLTLYGLQNASNPDVALLTVLVGILKKLAKILQDVHERGFGHNDLHANNVVLDDTLNPTIVDFGYAMKFGELMFLKLVPLKSAVWSQFDPLLSVCGQLTCPENDVYSFGRLTYDVLFGDHWYPFEQWQRLEALVVKALSPCKENRPTLPEFWDCLHDLENICLFYLQEAVTERR